METLNVACIQMRSGTVIHDNIAMMDALVRKAAGDGAHYIQTPEMSGILQKRRSHLFEEIRPQEDDPLVTHAQRLSGELGIWLHIGSHSIKVGEEKAANRAFVFSPDGHLVTTYDKIHMFDVDLENGESWRESKVYKPGSTAKLVETDFGVFAISICYDLRFPALYREQALAGAHILTAPSSFTRQTGKAHWHILMRARAIENGAYMIAAAQGGDHEDGRETFGHSLIVNPWGEIIAELSHEEPDYLVAELDLSQVAKARGRIPNLENTREFVLEGGSVIVEKVA
ncbi:MAG: carbon-nitrogen hydrolase family protein [Pseudomonadota bacterium]